MFDDAGYETAIDRRSKEVVKHHRRGRRRSGIDARGGLRERRDRDGDRLLVRFISAESSPIMRLVRDREGNAIASIEPCKLRDNELLSRFGSHRSSFSCYSCPKCHETYRPFFPLCRNVLFSYISCEGLPWQ